MELPILFIDLDDKNSVNVIFAEIQNLNNLQYPFVNLKVKESNSRRINNFQLDVKMFQEIKRIQDLPDWVIIRMLLISGKLKDSDFQQRISNG